VSTTPEQLMSDSFGFICGSIFAGYVRIKLLVQVCSPGFSNLSMISKKYYRLSYIAVYVWIQHASVERGLEIEYCVSSNLV